MNSEIGVEYKSQLGLLKDLSIFHIDEKNFAVRIEQINSRIRLYPRIVISQLAIAFLLVGVMWNGVAHDVLLAWLALACAAHTVELVYWLRLHRRAQNIAQCRRWNLGFCWFSGIVGIIWGSTGLLMFVPGQMLYQTFLICVVLGISGAAVTSNPVHPPSLLIHLGAMILPLLVRVLWVGDWTHLFLGSMLIIYMAHRVLMGKKLICRMLKPLILIGKCSSVDGCNSGMISRWLIHLNSSVFLMHIPSLDFVRRAMFLVCSAIRKLVSSLLSDAKKNRLQHMRLFADGFS
jgi:hypothetical protein